MVIKSRPPTPAVSAPTPTLSTVVPDATLQDFEDFDFYDYKGLENEVSKSHQYLEFLSDAEQDILDTALAAVQEAMSPIYQRAELLDFEIEP